ncbi:hypothetical protein IEQ34_015276 [Dendrobium chrysotoxum]|uniref:Uncharacterized protein n=1 Tax=Dendrobium chrysotoxum TaxID=161865 RepID=A0AAV7GHA7_DENCH|nr:hypothetical protein IEQ34_015276 [Dendrobium chrysotoxum]
MTGVVLGMPGPWAENFMEKADHYTTKIGGLPVYAPIKMPKSNVEERVIYVFGCLTSKCGSSPNKVCSWRALRIQKCTSEKLLNDIFQDSIPSKICNGDEKNLCSVNYISVEVDLVSDNGESIEEEYDDLDFGELARELSEAFSQASHSKKQKGSSILEATTKSVQSRPTLNDINSGIPAVPCFYIYPQEDQSFGEVTALCANYAALSVKQEDDSSNDQKEEEVWEGEGYEYDKALGADRTFLKFKKRMDAYPEQCFRYANPKDLSAGTYRMRLIGEKR